MTDTDLQRTRKERDAVLNMLQGYDARLVQQLRDQFAFDREQLPVATEFTPPVALRVLVVLKADRVPRTTVVDADTGELCHVDVDVRVLDGA